LGVPRKSTGGRVAKRSPGFPHSEFKGTALAIPKSSSLSAVRKHDVAGLRSRGTISLFYEKLQARTQASVIWPSSWRAGNRRSMRDARDSPSMKPPHHQDQAVGSSASRRSGRHWDAHTFAAEGAPLARAAAPGRVPFEFSDHIESHGRAPGAGPTPCFLYTTPIPHLRQFGKYSVRPMRSGISGHGGLLWYSGLAYPNHTSHATRPTCSNLHSASRWLAAAQR